MTTTTDLHPVIADLLRVCNIVPSMYVPNQWNGVDFPVADIAPGAIVRITGEDVEGSEIRILRFTPNMVVRYEVRLDNAPTNVAAAVMAEVLS
jgi:hypothetical protein